MRKKTSSKITVIVQTWGYSIAVLRIVKHLVTSSLPLPPSSRLADEGLICVVFVICMYVYFRPGLNLFRRSERNFLLGL